MEEQLRHTQEKLRLKEREVEWRFITAHCSTFTSSCLIVTVTCFTNEYIHESTLDKSQMIRAAVINQSSAVITNYFSFSPSSKKNKNSIFSSQM